MIAVLLFYGIRQKILSFCLINQFLFCMYARSDSVLCSKIIIGRGPLLQPSPGVSTTASPSPLGANAKRCTVGDLLKPQVAWGTCSPAPTGRAGASSDCRDLLQCVMGWRVVIKSYHMVKQ